MSDQIIIGTNSAQVVAELDAVILKSQELSSQIINSNNLMATSNATLLSTINAVGLAYASTTNMVNTFSSSVIIASAIMTNAILSTNILAESISLLNIVLEETNQKFEDINKSLIINSVLLLANSLISILETSMFEKLNKVLDVTNSKFESINKAMIINSALMLLNSVVSLVYQKMIEKENKSLTSNTTRRTNNNKRTAAGIGLKGFELGTMAGFPTGLVLGPAMAALFTGLAFGIVGMGTAALATGGIVSKPTIALVGEGKYPEAVVPLGDSPQFVNMKTEIANAVIQSMGITNTTSRPIEVIVNLDSREIARATEKGKRLNSAGRTATVGGVL